MNKRPMWTNTAHISISHPHTIDPHCTQVVDLLRSHGVLCSVTPNVSVQQGGILEQGCRVTLPFTQVGEVKKAWRILQEPLQLRCAHVWIPSIFSGCIFNLLQKSACPGGRP